MMRRSQACEELKGKGSDGIAKALRRKQTCHSRNKNVHCDWSKGSERLPTQYNQ
jgi:hypothetical protein